MLSEQLLVLGLSMQPAIFVCLVVVFLALLNDGFSHELGSRWITYCVFGHNLLVVAHLNFWQRCRHQP